MRARPFPRSWLLSAIGCGLVLSAQLWQPPFQRELMIIGMVSFLLAMTTFLRKIVSR